MKNSINAKIIDERDNVAVAIEAIEKGQDATYLTDSGVKSVKTATEVPIYHKLAVKDIAKGEHIMKYGEHIGVAATDIKAGEHVHVHNVESQRESL